LTLTTIPFDAATLLDTADAIEAYLEAAFETEDPAVIAQALGVVARARGMTDLADQTGLNRPALYRALTLTGNPEFATVLKVANALGFRLRPKRKAPT